MSTTIPWYTQYQDEVQKDWKLFGWEALVQTGMVYVGTQSNMGKRLIAFVPGGDLVRMLVMLGLGLVVAEWGRMMTGWPSLPCTAVAVAPK